METAQTVANPFALMTNPEVVLRAIEQSQSLARLRGQVFHPLDKPLLSVLPQDLAEFDRLVDREWND
jgi:hypothetical protein